LKILIAIGCILVLVACTQVYIKSSGEKPVNVQTTDTTSVFSSVNVTSADKASKGVATGHVSSDNTAKTTSVIPITTAPIIPK
jgi:mRNA-degrading endonuclease toxin of MazEF toxin-antitoxin module